MQGNEFAGTDIHLPSKYREYFAQYCLTRAEGSKNTPEDSPFPRMIDMWFLALCLAVKEGAKPDLGKHGETYKAIEGVVLGSDPWRSNILVLLAIAYTGDIEIAEKPNEMMKIANGFAIAGVPLLVGRLERRGGDAALDHLSDEIESLIG